jgi:hypothetical protein
MTATSSKKLIAKLATLFALTVCLAFLGRPQAAAQAKTKTPTGCIGECNTAFEACIDACKSNKTCIAACQAEDESCIECCLHC